MSRRIPREAVAVDAQTGDRSVRGRRPREILLIGEVMAGLRLELAERGAVLTDVATFDAAFEQLAARIFDVIAIDPYLPGAIDFVSVIKEGETEHQRTIATLYGARGDAPFLKGVRPPPLETLVELRTLYRTVPFIVLPDRNGAYRVIVVPPHASYVENVSQLPVVTTILSVDQSKLLLTSQPLA